MYFCLGWSPKIVGSCQAPALTPSSLGVGVTLHQHLSASPGASAVAVEEALGPVTDGSRRITDARAPAGRPGGALWSWGVSPVSVLPGWSLAQAGEGVAPPARSLPLPVHGPWHRLRNSTLSQALPSFLSRVQGCCLPRPHLEQVTRGCRRQRAGCSGLPGGAEAAPSPVPAELHPRPCAPWAG